MSDSAASLFSPDLIFYGTHADSPAALLAQLSDELTARDLIGDGWLDAMLERERRFPTGLAMPAINIAVPHVDTIYVRKPYIALVAPAAPVRFEGMAGQDPVDATLIFNLGIANKSDQVGALQAVLDICMDPTTVYKLGQAGSAEELYRAICEHFGYTR